MHRLDALFQQKKEGILSIYFTAGFPNLNDTVPLLETLQANGVDLIEIGMPFSDPLADGPVIQDSSLVALKNGMSIPELMEQLKDIRQTIHVPLILMGYINPVLQYGIERFCKDAAAIGIDGVILPDLPLEEYEREYKSYFESQNLRNIFLITPQTSEQRIRQIDAASNGFIYMVSTASTTGNKVGTQATQFDYFRKIQSMGLKNPRMIGFGIKNREHFLKANEYAAGAIIGTAFIQALQSKPNPLEAATKFVQAILEH